MNHTYIKFVAGLIMIVFLSGCLYPSSERTENQVPYEDQLALVQSAVEKYQKTTNGMLPIDTKPAETPIFEKYLIDFQQLKDSHILSSLPGNSFEKGGIYKYVLTDVENNPQVKLIDLRITDELRNVFNKIDSYRAKHTYPPFGKEITKGVYTINYKKIGMKHEPYVVSPYSDQNLPVVMDAKGDIYVDYRIDLQQALDAHDHNFQNGDDIRYIIAENSPFVPAYSLPYTVENNKPVFMINY